MGLDFLLPLVLPDCEIELEFDPELLEGAGVCCEVTLVVPTVVIPLVTVVFTEELTEDEVATPPGGGDGSRTPSSSCLKNSGLSLYCRGKKLSAYV